ncbi:MAG: SseB family protein, partial [Erysipelotrichaceae bacterium]|nr:SseB family protein [Erysipelotrichaceae bacterium]
AFTDSNELHKGDSSDSVVIDLETFLEAALKSEGIFGAVINPWSENIILTKELIHVILNEEV